MRKDLGDTCKMAYLLTTENIIVTVRPIQWWIQGFGPGVKFQKFRPNSPMLCNITALQYILHEMIEIEIKMKTGFCESRTQGTFSKVSIEIHLGLHCSYFLNIKIARKYLICRLHRLTACV